MRRKGAFVYGEFRTGVASLSASVPLFAAIGNWEGENGWLSADEIALARSVRKQYLPNPTNSTYPQGGSEAGDYYAWDWGDALFIVLNVMSYTLTDHRNGLAPGSAEDWTLGREQLSWLEKTLSGAREKWKFVFIHHPVGGNGSRIGTSKYGRGGGRAAHVGEQAKVQELLRRYGVDVFFYGHDHCFADMIVDGIHYTGTGCSGDADSFCGESGNEDALEARGHILVSVSSDSVEVGYHGMRNERLGEFSLVK